MKKWLIILALLLLLLGCKPGGLQPKPEKEILIKDLIINELGGNYHLLSFMIQNLKDSAAKCSIKITLPGEPEILKEIGVIKANSEEKRQVKIEIQKDGNIQVDVQPVCEWGNYSTEKKCAQEDATEKRVCELTAGKPELKQCLDTNITYYTFFCMALTTNDPTLCNEISSDMKKNWCKAYITKDPDLCGNIKAIQDRDWCYSDMGMNFRDNSICAKISDIKSKTSCTAVATKNPEMCLQGSEGLKLSCITNLAEMLGKKDLCDLLGPEQKLECLENLK